LSPAEPGQKHKPLPEKQTKAKRAGSVAEHLSSNHEILSSNPSITSPKRRVKENQNILK
jgi:hypothetical protein